MRIIDLHARKAPTPHCFELGDQQKLCPGGQCMDVVMPVLTPLNAAEVRDWLPCLHGRTPDESVTEPARQRLYRA